MPRVEVYDTLTGGWVAGYWITDEQVDPPCGSRVWMGEPATRSCGEAALAWVEAHFQTCSPHQGPCEPARCVSDERV